MRHSGSAEENSSWSLLEAAKLLYYKDLETSWKSNFDGTTTPLSPFRRCQNCSIHTLSGSPEETQMERFCCVYSANHIGMMK